VFVLAFVVNPALLGGCNTIFPFQYGEAEMVAIVDGANRAGPYRFESEGQVYQVSFQVSQQRGDDKVSGLGPSGWAGQAVRQAQACGNRSFLRSASACLDTTEVPVEGALTVTHVGAGGGVILGDTPARGELRVVGKVLEGATLTLGAGGVFVHVLYKKATDSYRVTSVTAPAKR
jgi:hypothetical protein